MFPGKKTFATIGILAGVLLAMTNPEKADAKPDYSIEVLSSDAQSTVLRFSLHSFSQKKVTIEGESYTTPALEGTGSHLKIGFPELPKISLPVAVPTGSSIGVSLSEKTSSLWDLGQPAPSKGDFERNIRPADVPWTFSDLYRYRDQKSFPADALEQSSPYQIRSLSGVTVHFSPFLYHWESGLTEVISEAIIHVETKTSAPGVNYLKHSIRELNPDFAPVYQNSFLNLKQLQAALIPERIKVSADRGELLIISHSAFTAGLQEFIAWKRQLGFRVKLAHLGETGSQPEQIKAYIQNRYDQNAGLSYILLVGDAEFVPFHPGTSGNARGNEADPMYGLLAGNDSYPEVPVARFSVKNLNELDTVISKGMHYEKMPAMQNWFQHAANIASSDGSPTDYWRADKLRATMLSEGRFQAVDKIYDPGARASDVMTVLNQGRYLVNYIGHGTETAWVTTWFDRQHIAELKNTGKLPVIVSVACVNGRFAWNGGDSFAEVWQKTSQPEGPTGAIAIFASSTNQSWVPPTVGQARITQIASKREAGNIGPLLMAGSVAVLDDGSWTAVQTFQTWHIFGDPTIAFRNTAPSQINISGLTESSAWEAEEGVLYTGPGLRATISSPEAMIATVLADSEGRASFRNLPATYRGIPLTLTVSGQNHVPEVRTVVFHEQRP